MDLSYNVLFVLGDDDGFAGHYHAGKPEIKISVRRVPAEFSDIVRRCVRFHFLPESGNFERVRVLSLSAECWAEIVCEECGSVIAHLRDSCVAECSWREIEDKIREITSRRRGE